ncbi:hypothetical protein PENSUB_3804 [Penicillium subrubescens]|uniref:Uncharacterized protein n=1 Tax=Penicillium subrubescens TaxID=1316194 RepID=A0A1Q5UDG6_9EURO|nr:hypothetical protein PENSUB_3804 [Penicillium subrubescens]
MNFLLLLFLVFFAPLMLFAGETRRPHILHNWEDSASKARKVADISTRNRLRTRDGRFSARPVLDTYGQSYLRTMANSGASMSEQIELDDMLAEPGTRRHFDGDED